MVQLECTYAGLNSDGVWTLAFSDGSGIEFPDEEAYISYCSDQYIDVVAVESLRRVTAVRKFNNETAIATFDINEASGNVVKVS
jgi:hypothetical protein